MVNKILDTEEMVVFEKTDRKEAWFNHNCSDENLLKILKREDGYAIERVQWHDGAHIASLMHVYLIKNK